MHELNHPQQPESQPTTLHNVIHYGDVIVLGGKYVQETHQPIHILMGSEEKDALSVAKSKGFNLRYMKSHLATKEEISQWLLSDPDRPDVVEWVLKDDTDLEVGRHNHVLFPEGEQDRHLYVSERHVAIVPHGELISIKQLSATNPTYITSPDKTVVRMQRFQKQP
jgi:hypothetical protein